MTQLQKTLRAIRGYKRGNKYGAKKTVVDGITFDSKREAKRYVELKTLEKAGKISMLRLQVPLAIEAVNIHVGTKKIVSTYKCDFMYFHRAKWVYEDVKGVRTPVYKLKKKLVEALYGITITEI